jgi:hypothetical protein
MIDSNTSPEAGGLQSHSKGKWVNFTTFYILLTIEDGSKWAG